MTLSFSLSEADQNAIENQLSLCLHRAGIAFQRSITRPSIHFKLRGKAAGKAYLQRNEIRLNPVLFQENRKAFIEEVIPHEIAHLVVYQIFGLAHPEGSKVRPHGKEWQMVMEKVFTVPARTTHSFEISSVQGKTFEYQCRCDTHTLTIRRHNRVIRQESRYLCRSCGETLVFTGRQIS